MLLKLEWPMTIKKTVKTMQNKALYHTGVERKKHDHSLIS